jgi:amidophosphoribosyltransferase
MALNPELDGFEASCFDGHYVTGDVSAADFEALQVQRRAQPEEEDDPGRSRLSLQSAVERT